MILTPVMRRLGRALGVAATELLIPLSYVAILDGALTLIGTSTIVYAAGGYRFSDFLKIGLPMNAIVGVATCAANLVAVPSGAHSTVTLFARFLGWSTSVPFATAT